MEKDKFSVKEKERKMIKETVICVVLVVAILFGNTITQDYSKKAVEDLSQNLLFLREEITKSEVDQEKAKKETEKLEKEWKEKQNKLAYYIEHNELEKIEVELTAIQSHIETQEYQDSTSEIDKSIFLLEHIKDKYAFKLQNIF